MTNDDIKSVDLVVINGKRYWKVTRVWRSGYRPYVRYTEVYIK